MSNKITLSVDTGYTNSVSDKCQISNFVYCDKFVLDMDLETKFFPNQYYDFPFLVIEDFFSKQKCHQIRKHINDNNNFETAMIKNTLKGVVNPKVNQNIRKTKIYKLPDVIVNNYQKRFNKYQNQIENFYAIALTNASKIQPLVYETGGFYAKHADDSNEIVNSQKETVGFNQIAPLRKMSTVLFISSYTDNVDNEEEFSGGELLFNYLYDKDNNNIVFKPKAGTMLIFPSNPIFSHEVLPVKDGKRITLVQWHNAILE